MAEKHKTGFGERGWRFLRDVNVLGALAIGGLAAIIPGPNALLATYAGFNAAQAGGFELLRQHSHNKRSKTEHS